MRVTAAAKLASAVSAMRESAAAAAAAVKAAAEAAANTSRSSLNAAYESAKRFAESRAVAAEKAVAEAELTEAAYVAAEDRTRVAVAKQVVTVTITFSKKIPDADDPTPSPAVQRTTTDVTSSGTQNPITFAKIPAEGPLTPQQYLDFLKQEGPRGVHCAQKEWGLRH